MRAAGRNSVELRNFERLPLQPELSWVIGSINTGDTLRKMEPDQKKFLQGRFRKAVVEQPELKPLKSLLLSLSGDFVVPPAKHDADIPSLLKSGFLIFGSLLSCGVWLGTQRAPTNIQALS